MGGRSGHQRWRGAVRRNTGTATAIGRAFPSAACIIHSLDSATFAARRMISSDSSRKHR